MNPHPCLLRPWKLKIKFVCPVNPVTDKITTHELSVCSVSSKLSDIEPLVCSFPSNVSYELSVCTKVAFESDVELSVCSCI